MMDLLDRLAREAPPPVARIAYGPAAEQFADLRLPAGSTAGAAPLVIVIHGGYWRSRFGLDYFGVACGALARVGLATFNIEYRRLGNAGGGWPGTFEDVARAADMAPTLAERYPVDPAHVLALGHSAGGQLALWLAARRRLPETSPLWSPSPVSLVGAVSLAGVVDLRRAWELRLSGNVTEQLLGGSPDTVPERYAVTSPYALLPLGAPQVLFHGDRDDNVPIELSERYAERARALGEPVTFEPLAGAGHFELVDPATPEWGAVERQALRLAVGRA